MPPPDDDDSTIPGRKPPQRPPDPRSRPSGSARPSPAATRPPDRSTVPGPVDDGETVPAARPAAPRPAAAARPASQAPTAPRPAAAQARPAAARPAAPRPAPGKRAPAEATPADPTKRWSVLPDEPGRTPTMAQKLTRGVQRAWGMTAIAVGGAVFLGVFGMWLIGQGHPVFGIITMGAILPLTFTALFIRRAPCPNCQTSITVINIDRCGKCGAYVRLENQQTVLVEGDFIAPLATFEVDIPLPVIPRLAWPEEGFCIVCAEKAGAADEILDIQGHQVPIPHCGDHQEGLTWSLGMSSTAVTMVKMKFRSWRYYNLFLAANEVHTRQGMWR